MNKKITLTAMLATIALVGFFAIAPDVVNNTVQAAPPATTQNVNIVSSTTLPVAETHIPLQVLVTNPPPPQTCEVQHWDKIVFRVTISIDQTIASNTPILLGRQYDIKVLDDPTTVADLSQKVSDFLNSKGYIEGGTNNDPVIPDFIQIVDVEYAIVCAPLPGLG